MKFEGFIGGPYKMGSLPISAQRCINFYPEPQKKSASTAEALRPTPGYRELVEIEDATLPGGSFNRGNFRTSRGLGLTPENNGSILTVMGPNIYWFKSDNTYELIGSISNLDSKVQAVDDGFGMVIPDGVGLYRLNLETKVFQRLAFDLIDPSGVVFIEGYTIAIGQYLGLPQNTFFWSGLYDNESWNPLDYAQAEQSQDPITAIIVAGVFIWLFGPNSYELWNTTGDSSMPFSRAYASSGAVGIHAPKSLTKLSNNVFFIGSNNQGAASAYMSQGYEVVQISTIALDQEWNDYDVSDCTTWTYSKSGHDFVVFDFDSMDKTYQYNVRTGLWNQVASREPLTDTLHRWEPNFGIQQSNRLIVGDRNSTKLFLMGNQYTTENGNNIVRIRTTAHQNAEQKMMMIKAVRIDLETGNGINNEDPDRYTEAPRIMFRYAHDRGRTWSSELREEIGRTGDYLKTVEFARLGACRNFTCEIKISDSANTSILNGFIYIEISARSRR